MSRTGMMVLLCVAFPVLRPSAHAQDPVELRSAAMRALQQGDHPVAIRKVDEMLKSDPDNVRAKMFAGDVYLRSGAYKKAVKQFDAFLEREPQQLPYLWQRGIALYFAGDFKEGVKQFEVHRKVNPNDVENAAWHFLCLAKAESFEKAGTTVLPAPGDPRIPMEEVLQMLNTGDTQPVIDRIEKEAKGSVGRAEGEFYGYFYLGLYEDAKGNRGEALRWMKQSAKDAPKNYMGDVARVYASFLAEETNSLTEETKGNSKTPKVNK